MAERFQGIGKETVAVNVGEIFPLLADAIQRRRSWLGDFHDDEMVISRDLYEVVQAYQIYRRAD